MAKSKSRDTKPEWKALCILEECELPVENLKTGYCNRHYLRHRRHGDPRAGQTGVGVPMEFLRDITDTDECVEWPYGTAARGYPVIRYNGCAIGGHRLSLMLHKGPPPTSTDRWEAAHGCNNKICVNPKHLRWATNAENQADMIIHGTAIRGTRSGNSKLTELQVLSVVDDPRGNKVIGDEYGVCHSAIWSIRVGKTWAWLTGVDRYVPTSKADHI